MKLNEFEQYLISAKHYEDELFRDILLDKILYDEQEEKEREKEYNKLVLNENIKLQKKNNKSLNITESEKLEKKLEVVEVVEVKKPSKKATESSKAKKDENSYLQRIRVKFTRNNIPGFNVYLSLTRMCNFACLNCPSFSYNAAGTKNVWAVDVDQLVSDLTRLQSIISIRGLHITGGDPVLLGFTFLENVLGKLREVLGEQVDIILHIPSVNVRENLLKCYDIFNKYNIKLIVVLNVKSGVQFINGEKHSFNSCFDEVINKKDPSKNIAGIQYIYKFSGEDTCGISQRNDKTCRQIFLHNSKLYLCPKQAHADLIDNNFIDNPTEYVKFLDIYDKDFSKKTLRDFYLQDETIFCKNCHKLVKLHNCNKKYFTK